MQMNGNVEPVRTWAYTVKAGDELKDTWPLHEFGSGRYHLRLYGPNGFYRELTGDANDPEIIMVLDHQKGLSANTVTGNVVLKLTNTGSHPKTVEITDQDYKVNHHKKTIPAHSSLDMVLDLQKSYGWYSFKVNIAGSNAFSRHYAGHVETGRPSYSDPHMGRVVAEV
jgi:phospholipase C